MYYNYFWKCSHIPFFLKHIELKPLLLNTCSGCHWENEANKLHFSKTENDSCLFRTVGEILKNILVDFFYSLKWLMGKLALLSSYWSIVTLTLGFHSMKTAFRPFIFECVWWRRVPKVCSDASAQVNLPWVLEWFLSSALKKGSWALERRWRVTLQIGAEAGLSPFCCDTYAVPVVCSGRCRHPHW